ncbi:respiratory nitrate reductase subunit gamma [Anaeromyxobacter dehalogenans]|uniref:Respiratory nitrate reductase gamma subunit n=1 Tax=Anaeromyxobacter dehalogenans (strain 2CP-C) TaxID=290397 RepID=Q2IJW0_ANADE|nr:respiratory nitrate reductase subunit gamma [Anaeromyxobacter dehalogenans]ABC81943.1 respiratory nitrate reductase gamma subunit [Anaeromyxobacter dehalogenans 2CP-C]
MSDTFLFAVFPYLATVFAVGGAIYRRRALGGSVSARSSQLIEGRALRWGSIAWHHGILAILAAHLIAAVAPGAWGRLLGAPARLYALEITGMALAMLAVFGIALLLVRRAALARLTAPMDWVVLALLLLQAATGLWIAYALRWGGLWYLHTAAPWLASLATLSPRVDAMAVLPPLVKVHVVNAFVLLALVPVSRLVHATSLPLAYLWRAPQRVVWRRAPAPSAAPAASHDAR